MATSPTTGAALLHEVQRLPTSGARAVEPFVHDGEVYLAVPQLAADIAGQAASMAGGNSDVDTIVYRWAHGRFVEHQRLPVPGGEDAEFFGIGARRFLATASLRSGQGPYSMDVQSVLYEFEGGRFVPFQRFDTWAAKQWKHFCFDDRHFLALAQGVTHAGTEGGHNADSCIFEWDGARFVPFQTIASAWGYNWCFMEVGGRRLLAYADHVAPSRLLAWNGRAFEPFQQFEGGSGRAFCQFNAHGQSWLAFASLHGDSVLYRWAEKEFVPHQRLSGPGGREFEWLPHGTDDDGRLIEVNFILGTREAPRPVPRSFVLAWNGSGFEVVEEFESTGGTDAAAFEADGVRYLAVANSLDQALRFRTDTCIYRVAPR